MSRSVLWPVIFAASGVASAAPAKPAPSPPPTAKMWSIPELTTVGAKVTKLSDTESLVCAHDSCVCMKDLACGPRGCITLTDNLAVFRKALQGNNDRSVDCEIADTGQLCDLSYFRFEGDIYRWETRFFDASGHLVAQRNATDYPEYCGGKASIQITGKLPDCAAPTRNVQLICAEPQFKSRVGVIPNPRSLLMP